MTNRFSRLVAITWLVAVSASSIACVAELGTEAEVDGDAESLAPVVLNTGPVLLAYEGSCAWLACASIYCGNPGCGGGCTDTVPWVARPNVYAASCGDVVRICNTANGRCVDARVRDTSSGNIWEANMAVFDAIGAPHYDGRCGCAPCTGINTCGGTYGGGNATVTITGAGGGGGGPAPGPVPAPEPPPPDEPGGSMFRSAWSGMVMEVASYSTRDGGKVVQWTSHATGNQRWIVEPAGDGFYTLRNAYSGKCLDVAGWSTSDDGNLVQWACHGGDNQQWELIDAGDGYSMLRSRFSQKCIDVASWSTSDGGNLVQWECTGEDNQRWFQEPT